MALIIHLPNWMNAWHMPPLERVQRMPEVPSMGTLGEAYFPTGLQSFASSSKIHNLSKLENVFGNLFGRKTWPYLI